MLQHCSEVDAAPGITGMAIVFLFWKGKSFARAVDAECVVFFVCILH